MKMIIAVVKPAVTEAVIDALTDTGISGLMVSEVRGYGRQKGHTEIYRSAEYEVTLVPKVRFEIAVDDSLVDVVVDTIAKVAHTGRIGDGKVFVLDLLSALRIRTGEKDLDAVAA